jgi:hypothetical protein
MLDALMDKVGTDGPNCSVKVAETEPTVAVRVTV